MVLYWKTEQVLLGLAVKGRDLTVALPKFYIMTIDELPDVFFRGLIVGAYEPDCAADMAILVKDVCSILGHVAQTCSRCSLRVLERPAAVAADACVCRKPRPY